MTRYRPLAERFWEKVEVRGEDDCWEWIGGKHHLRGYGQMGIGPNPYRPRYKASVDYAHHIVLFLAGIDIPEGSHVHHTCENKTCVNPRHLETISPTDHMELHVRTNPLFANRDQWQTGECKRGHELNETNVGYYAHGRRYCKRCASERYYRRLGRQQTKIV